jgi:poly-beta-1,6-N-acetyl-D-glucosamine synthase
LRCKSRAPRRVRSTVQPRILIVSPVRNEAAHIERVVRGVAAQTLQPARWIVLDDGSTDGTLELLRSLEPTVPFLKVIERASLLEGARDRLARAAAPRAFNAALATDDWRQYTHVMKLDGDIELAPTYLADVIARFEADPQLGLAGGVLVEPQADGSVKPIRIPETHVHGALKLYSRECFEAIGGVQERLGWDTIDEIYARMRGFGARSFKDLVSVHHRPIGSADGTLRGHARHGQCAYIAHYDLLFTALRAVKVGRRHPRVLSGFAFLYGYVRAAAARTERVPDPDFRRYVRRELRQRMVGAVVPREVAS